MPENIFKTISEESYDSYCDFNRSQAVPSAYFTVGRSGQFISEKENLLNQEMIKFAEQSKSFDFLSSPEEDIYTSDDGEAIC